jgi:hypothetical protein
MAAAEQLACERGVTTLGITVGLFDEYGPAQRLYGQQRVAGSNPAGRTSSEGTWAPRQRVSGAKQDHVVAWVDGQWQPVSEAGFDGYQETALRQSPSPEAIT